MKKWEGVLVPEEVLFVIILGGPISVYQIEKYPFLLEEER